MLETVVGGKVPPPNGRVFEGSEDGESRVRMFHAKRLDGTIAV